MFVWNQAFHMVNVATIHSNTNKCSIQPLKSLAYVDNLCWCLTFAPHNLPFYYLRIIRFAVKIHTHSYGSLSCKICCDTWPLKAILTIRKCSIFASSLGCLGYLYIKKNHESPWNGCHKRLKFITSSVKPDRKQKDNQGCSDTKYKLVL